MYLLHANQLKLKLAPGKGLAMLSLEKLETVIRFCIALSFPLLSMGLLIGLYLMLKNVEKQQGKVAFKAPLVVAPPTYNIVDELKAEGDWEVLQRYSGFEFDDNAPKAIARTEYENMLYLERPGCNLCMGNQEKASKGDTVIATSTRLFQGRVVEDSTEKKGESLLSSTPVVVLSTILGRTPSIEEYKLAVEGINLTKFAPSHKLLVG